MKILALLLTWIFGGRFLSGHRGAQIIRSVRRSPGEVGAVTIIGTGHANYQYGVGSIETGINCESIEVEYLPEVNEELQGIGGETFLRAVSATPSSNVTIEGEVGGTTGIMALVWITAATVANTVNTFAAGGTMGGLYMESATVTGNRKAWEKVNVKLKSRPAIA